MELFFGGLFFVLLFGASGIHNHNQKVIAELLATILAELKEKNK